LEKKRLPAGEATSERMTPGYTKPGSCGLAALAYHGEEYQKTYNQLDANHFAWVGGLFSVKKALAHVHTTIS